MKRFSPPIFFNHTPVCICICMRRTTQNNERSQTRLGKIRKILPQDGLPTVEGCNCFLKLGFEPVLFESRVEWSHSRSLSSNHCHHYCCSYCFYCCPSGPSPHCHHHCCCPKEFTLHSRVPSGPNHYNNDLQRSSRRAH